MAPKPKKKKSLLTEPQINHDLYVSFLEVTNEDALEVLNIFRIQGWKHFLNHQPRWYIDEQVVEFY